MTIEQGKQELKSFIQKAEKDGDPYFLAHFSRQEDLYNGMHEGMDKGDAMILVKHLIKFFEIDPMWLNMVIGSERIKIDLTDCKF